MKRNEWIAACAVIAVLLVLAVSSDANRRPAARAGEMPAAADTASGRALPEPDARDSSQAADTASVRALLEPDARDSSQATAAPLSGPELSPDQTAGMNQLEKAMKSGDKEKAARILLDKRELFRQIFYETAESVRFLYRDGKLWQEIDGDGLVLTSAGACFYGQFADGTPRGEGTALQAVKIDRPRYDYAEGRWKDGMLEGSGTLGYRYYEDAPEGEIREVKKEGRFSEDRMNGEITYTSYSRGGEATAWKINVRDGVTQLDDRWTQAAGTKEYQLPAQSDPGRVYVLTEAEAAEVRWVNLLGWGTGDEISK